MSQKSTNDLLSNALSALSSHRELIHEVYTKGSYTRNGSKLDRDAFVLHQNRIFVSDGRDSFRLSGLLTKFFDEVTQKQRLFELLGEQAGAQVHRISQLMDEYGKAIVAGGVEEADQITAQFHDACADLSDTFTSGISKLLNLAETNFAVVSSIEAKSRQNAHYLSQTRRFSDALDSLDRYGIERQLSVSFFNYDPLLQSYRDLISSRKSEWHTEITHLLRFFETYLYKLRDITPDVKRFRQFANFLQQNPGYELPELLEGHHRPLWMMRAPAIRPMAHADRSDASASDYLLDLASRLPSPKDIVLSKERPSGVIDRSANRPPERISLPPHHVALLSFARAAATSSVPVSALGWKNEHCADLKVSDEAWLLLVTSSRNIRRNPFAGLQYSFLERRGESRLSRNLFVRDVMVHGS